MSEEPIDDDAEDEKPDVLSAMYNRLQLGGVAASLMMNASVRDEILLALIRIGALTAEQLTAALDRGEKNVEEMATDFDAPGSNKYVVEIAQQMCDRAKAIRDSTLERVIERSSQAHQ